jgi:formate hydrogenlyase subunit 6/NADH:ubiquinone oxidoreductase subunit I
LLAAAGTAPAALPRLERIPASPRLRQDEAPALPARRALFAHLLGGGEANAAAPAGTAAHALPRRTRALAMLARIQERRGGGLPAALFPELRVGSACTDCGVCAALCPTGALASYTADGASGLSFDAARCTACGRCAEVCRDGAVALSAHREGAAPTAREILTRFEARACLRCETEFAGDGEERFCPRCRLDRGLFTHAPGRATTGSGPAAVHG